MKPTISSRELCLQASERARNTWIQDGALGISRERNEDFRTVSGLPGCDHNIVQVMMFDLLIAHIFSGNALYGNHDLQKEVDVINRLEQSMRLNSDSTKRECMI